MSLFGTSPTSPKENEPSAVISPGRNRGGRSGGLFDEDAPQQKSSGGGLFDNGGDADDSPWSMPTPRKQQSRAQMIRNLLPSSDVPDSYIETFDTLSEGSGSVSADGVAKVFAAARLAEPATQTRIVTLVSPDASGDDVHLNRAEFNVLLALVGLAQEGEVINLDGVDERRKNLPRPKLAGLTAEPVLPPIEELAAKPPQTPIKEPQTPRLPINTTQTGSPSKSFRPAMDDPEDDPWNTPDLHKNHNHAHQPASNGIGSSSSQHGTNGFSKAPEPSNAASSASQQHAAEQPTSHAVGQESSAFAHTPGWGRHFDGPGADPVSNFSHSTTQDALGAGFGGAGVGGIGGGGSGPDRTPGPSAPSGPSRRVSGRTGPVVEETITVALLPEKEGMFLFQHHNYEVSSQRRGSKVIRRYSDFVWLLDCLHKRYPFRVLPLLPPKRVAVNGNHLSNDGGFIEKRRRGLSRFLNALTRHPILSQEQLVVMFLTVPTELSVWRKQANLSVQDEFNGRGLPQGLEESLPASLEELFARTRAGVRRSAELYINICHIMDRLVKRQEGVAADHGRIATMLGALIETSNDTYATDNNEVPLLNDGLTAMSKHLQTSQALVEDESRGWDEGVLEDLKRQRDSLVSVRELFDRRDRLDKDNIPYLERRIQANETKLANLRSKPEGMVKAADIEKVAEAIIKDKESIVQQHNRSIFVKEAIRDELVTFQSSQYHVSRWNQDWAGERAKYAELLADNWRRLLDELEGMPLGD